MKYVGNYFFSPLSTKGFYIQEIILNCLFEYTLNSSYASCKYNYPFVKFIFYHWPCKFSPMPKKYRS